VYYLDAEELRLALQHLQQFYGVTLQYELPLLDAGYPTWAVKLHSTDFTAGEMRLPKRPGAVLSHLVRPPQIRD
jgi:hypothetical protein